MNIEIGIAVWLITWAVIGSSLGYFTIRYNSIWPLYKKIGEYCLSVGVGTFFAFPTYVCLSEFSESTSQDLNIMIAGSVAFTITDLIIESWHRILYSVGNAADKLLDIIINKIAGKLE